VDRFITAADAHGVLTLVAERLLATGRLTGEWDRALRGEARKRAAFDLVRERELRRLLAAFHARGVRVVLMKGASLAYTVYPRPDLRARVDTDVLIDGADRQPAFDVLASQGYGGTGHVAGSLVMYQACYVKGRVDASIEAVDLHWKVANPQVFADLLSFGDVVREAEPIVALGAGAFGLSPVHALLVACVHRVAHHYDSSRLIWLYDIHLLSSRLTTSDWARFEALARSRGVGGVCRRSLDLTMETLGTTVPSAVLAGEVAADDNAMRAFLGAKRRRVDVVLSDIRALPSWTDRARLVGQHVFPSAVYMRSQYAPTSSAPLAVLYAMRVARGAWKWLARA
jgi:hypothetical protein